MTPTNQELSLERRYDLDWLRTISMLAVFLFHCARFFDADGWHVKDTELSVFFSQFTGFLVMWIMPIFMLLAGQSTYYSLQFRSARQFIKARTQRLAIPFIMGVFILIPPQVYLERLSNGDYSGGLFSFYPHYFEGWYGFGGNFAWMGLHLWFLELLFLYSILVLPLFLLLSNKKWGVSIRRIMDKFSKPFAIYLLGIPFIILEISLNPEGLGMRAFGGWSIIHYLIFFIFGYLIALSPPIQKRIEAHRWTSLLMALVLHIFFAGVDVPISREAYLTVRALDSWYWLMAILGFGRRYLNRSSSHLKYLNELTLPFYILHQTVILIIGYFVIQLAVPLGLKYFLIVVLSLLAIMLIFEIGIKRTNVMRLLFGMKKFHSTANESGT